MSKQYRTCEHCGANLDVGEKCDCMQATNKPDKYLVKVRYSLSGLRVYKVKTDNIYRIVGKIYSTSLEAIKRIDYSIYKPEREQFWIDNGYKIYEYKEPKLIFD